MAKFHSEAAKRASLMAAVPFEALCMDELRELHKMLADRDLGHVDDELFRQEVADSVLEQRMEAARRRAREMNAELPTAQREVMQLKGMI